MGTGRDAYGFAIRFPGADIDALCKRVVEVGTEWEAYRFAIEVPGANKELFRAKFPNLRL